MKQEIGKQILDTLFEIRDGQRKIISYLEASHETKEKEISKFQSKTDESVELYRQALQRQKVIILIIVPVVLLCIIVVTFLILKIF